MIVRGTPALSGFRIAKLLQRLQSVAPSVCAIETQWAARSDDRLRHHVLTHWSWSQAAKALVDAYNITLLAASSVR